MNPLLFKDFYKVGHKDMYPVGTNLVYSNFTPRKARDPKIKEVVFFGLQYFIKEYLINRFNKDFFYLDEDTAVQSYKRVMDSSLGKDTINCEHIRALHRLGYLPIKIKALPEGTKCPIGVPCLTIVNTKPEFFWLTNTLETILSTTLWGACTSATTSYEYRKICTKYSEITCENNNHITWQIHDFSFRGMFGLEAAMISGAGHLLCFTGSDTIPVGLFLEQYYNANLDTELVFGSVQADEHSVSSLGIMDYIESGTFLYTSDNPLLTAELLLFERLITETCPTGIISLVSDTYDFWGVVTKILPALKNKILSRNGKVVIRPDSSPKTPVEILCGDPEAGTDHERKGLIECLWDIFGGTINSKGYKELDPHIGAIYGEAITTERADKILNILEKKSFASNNVCFGVGSYSFTMVSRDTLGFAIKATYGEVNGKPRDIFKDPKTDSGMKKSLRGRVCVYNDNGIIRVLDRCDSEKEGSGLLEEVFNDGILTKETSLKEIRERLL